jgi:hypothetical protein
MVGVVGSSLRAARGSRGVTKLRYSRTPLESGAVVGDSPVGEMSESPWTGHPSTMGHVESCGNLGGPSPKAKYYLSTDSEPVP